MKKFIIVFILCISFTKLFALSDLQIGIGTLGTAIDNVTLTDIVIENHNYFDENGTYGICEAITFSPYTFENAFYPTNFLLTAFIGPVMRFSASNINDFNSKQDFVGYHIYGPDVWINPMMIEALLQRPMLPEPKENEEARTR